MPSLNQVNEELTIKFLVCCAIFLIAMVAVSKSVMKKHGSKTCKAMYIGRGVVELLGAVLIVAVMGDRFTSYWDIFDAEYLSDFIDMSPVCFIAGIVMTVQFITGIIDLVRGLLKKN